MDILPGSALPFETGDHDHAFSRFTTILQATNGLTLSQLCHITGLNQTTIQNWIKRGWVASPKDKCYGEVHLARILLINMVREILPLEMIAELMTIVNGSVELREDDMLPDREWYDLLCRCILRMEMSEPQGQKTQKEMIAEILCDTPISEEDRLTLGSVLFIMLNAYEAACLKNRAETEWEILRNKKTERKDYHGEKSV